MSLVIAVITSLLCADILRAMSTPESIFKGAYRYLLITFIGVPCTFSYNLLSSIIRALGDSKTPFWFLLFSTVLNILLDLFCILVLDWEVAGAAVATVFSQGVSAVLCYFYMMRHFDILKATSAERKFNGALARTLMYIGVPMGLQFSITAVGSIMLQSANNALGTACVAAFTAAMRIKMFFMCPFESLGMAMATYSGQNYGAGKSERIWMGVKASVLMMIIYWAFTFLYIDVGSRNICFAFCGGFRTGNTERYGIVPAYIGFVLSGFGVTLYLALYYPGSRIYELCHAFGRFRDDCAYISQFAGSASFRLYGGMLR